MTYRIAGLQPDSFAPIVGLDDAALDARGFRRIVVPHDGGHPCRITLEDAPAGERVVLLAYPHHVAPGSPYRASGPIFVREVARERWDRIDEVPPVLKTRLLSVRAYDRDGVMVDADVVEGAAIEPTIARLFGNAGTDFLHVHFAKRGCFACRVDRA